VREKRWRRQGRHDLQPASQAMPQRVRKFDSCRGHIDAVRIRSGHLGIGTAARSCARPTGTPTRSWRGGAFGMRSERHHPHRFRSPRPRV
jgi:hypothetical protein